MIEKVEVPFTKSRGNLYHVPVRQWSKWGPLARQVFNEVYSSMWKSQHLFLHPKAQAHSRSHWKTTCWNAAWTAAGAVGKT